MMLYEIRAAQGGGSGVYTYIYIYTRIFGPRFARPRFYLGRGEGDYSMNRLPNPSSSACSANITPGDPHVHQIMIYSLQKPKNGTRKDPQMTQKGPKSIVGTPRVSQKSRMDSKQKGWDAKRRRQGPHRTPKRTPKTPKMDPEWPSRRL